MKTIHSIAQPIFMIGIFVLIISWGSYATLSKGYTDADRKKTLKYLYTLTGIVVLAAIGTFGIKE